MEMVVLGPKEIAGRLGCSVRTATRKLKDGTIVGWQIGPKMWRSTDVHVELYITESIRRQRELLGFRRPKPTTPGLSVTTPRVDRGGILEPGLSITGRQIPAEASLLGPIIRKRKLA